MFSKVSVLIPTRGRPERLRTLLESFERTTDGDSYETAELVFRIDDDDLESEDVLMGYHIITGPRLSGYASLPTFFNELALEATGDVLMCGNDDMVFKTVGWASIIIDAANKYPDGVFDLGVTTHNETHYPFATVSKRVVERLGFLFDPRIFWGDMFLRDVMAYFGRCEMLTNVEIDHDWVGIAPDRVFMEGEATRRSSHDSYHALAVTEAVDRLKELYQ